MFSLFCLGFVTVYEQFYSHWTMSSDLKNVRNQCNSNSMLCAGGGLKNSDVLELVSCGNCHAVLTPTSLNDPKYVYTAYWHMTDGQSFGFSPIYTINQSSADTFDLNDPFRLSWHLNQTVGGYRVGKISGLNSDNIYKKYIFIRL